MYNRNAWGTQNGLRTLLATLVALGLTMAAAPAVSAGHHPQCEETAEISYQPAGQTAKSTAVITLKWTAEHGCDGGPADGFLCLAQYSGTVDGNPTGAAYEYHMQAMVEQANVQTQTTVKQETGILPEGLDEEDYSASLTHGEWLDSEETARLYVEIAGALPGDYSYVRISGFGCEHYQEAKFACGPNCGDGEGTLVMRVG